MPLYEKHRFIAPTATEAAPSRHTREFIPSDREPVAKLTGDELGIEFRGPQDMPALRRAAQSWYDENLVGTTAKMSDGTEVRFNKRGLRESTKDNKADFLLRAVPSIRTIIEGGVVVREAGNRPHVAERVFIAAPVQLNRKIHHLADSVHKTADGQYQYDFTYDRDAGNPGDGAWRAHG
jgi:hypothetical protein